MLFAPHYQSEFNKLRKRLSAMQVIQEPVCFPFLENSPIRKPMWDGMTRRENDSLEQSGNHGSLFSRENLLRRSTLLFSELPAYPLGKGKGWMEGAYDQLHSLRKVFWEKSAPWQLWKVTIPSAPALWRKIRIRTWTYICRKTVLTQLFRGVT